MAIFYETQNFRLPDLKGQSLLDLCIKSKIPILHTCQGGGSCGTCRVWITSGLRNLPERNKLEQEMAQGRGFPKQERLSCQLHSNKGAFSFILMEDQKKLRTEL